MGKYYKLFFTILLSALSFSCKGPQGDMGPVGPQGLNGKDGENAYSKFYLIESNDQITKNDNSWTDYLVTNIIIDHDSSNVEIKLDMSAPGVSDSPEIAFRAKIGSTYSNATLMKWVTYNAIEKPSFTFLIQNVSKGTYSAGVQWNALTGGITTSAFQRANAYNRVIIGVY